MSAEPIMQVTYFDDRVYRIKEGDKYHYISSVSTRLGIEDKPFLLRWYADLGWEEARKRLHESEDRGKRIHFALWLYLNGGTVIYNPWNSPIYSENQTDELKKEAKGLFMILKNQDEMIALWKLQRFFEIVKPKVVASEETVYSIEDDIAGTLDMALEIQAGTYDVNGAGKLIVPETGVYIGDLKSGNQVSDSAWSQVAAYAVAFERMKGIKPKGAVILHTSAKSKKGIEGFSAELLPADELNVHYEIFKRLSFVWKQRNPNFGPKEFLFPSLIKGVKA